MTDNKKLIAEARGRAGSDMGLSDQLLRELADALEATTREMHARELHHFESEQAITEALRIDTHHMHPDARRILSAALEAAEKALTPTGDEREALANLIPLDLVHDRSREGFPKDAFEVADRILAAGFRRTVVPEPSTEAILSDVRSHAERWANRPPTSPYAMGLRDAWRTILSKIDQHHDLASCAWCSSTARGTAIWQGTDQRHPSCGLEEHGLQFESAEPQAEPSDARVEVAARAMFEPDGPGGEYTWAEMVVEDPSRADIWREDARRVLRAASSVTEQGENRGNAD